MFTVLPASMRAESSHPAAAIVASLLHAAVVSLGIVFTRQVIIHDARSHPLDPMPLFVTPRTAPSRSTTVASNPAPMHPPAIPIAVPLSVPAMVAVDLAPAALASTNTSLHSPTGSGDPIRGMLHEADMRNPIGGVLHANEVDQEVQLTRADTPTYPPAMRALGRAGSVRVQYVVDTAGVVERGSIVVLESSDSNFTLSARRVLATMRFHPARAHGRTVRQLVEQVIRFAIER